MFRSTLADKQLTDTDLKPQNAFGFQTHFGFHLYKADALFAGYISFGLFFVISPLYLRSHTRY